MYLYFVQIISLAFIYGSLWYTFIMKHKCLVKIDVLIIKTMIDNKMFVKSVLIFLDSILFMTFAVESTSFTSTKPILGVFLWAAIAIGV